MRCCGLVGGRTAGRFVPCVGTALASLLPGTLWGTRRYRGRRHARGRSMCCAPPAQWTRWRAQVKERAQQQSQCSSSQTIKREGANSGQLRRDPDRSNAGSAAAVLRTRGPCFECTTQRAKPSINECPPPAAEFLFIKKVQRGHSPPPRYNRSNIKAHHHHTRSLRSNRARTRRIR